MRAHEIFELKAKAADRRVGREALDIFFLFADRLNQRWWRTYCTVCISEYNMLIEGTG